MISGIIGCPLDADPFGSLLIRLFDVAVTSVDGFELDGRFALSNIFSQAVGFAEKPRLSLCLMLLAILRNRETSCT